MNRDRVILLIGAAFFVFGGYTVFIRLLQGTSLKEPTLALIEPSAIRSVMKEMGDLERELADALKLLTADDCAMIEFESLAIAKLANDLKQTVPGEVAKSSRSDWIKLMDATIASALALARVAGDGEHAEGPKISKAYRELTETCMVCHRAFGVE